MAALNYWNCWRVDREGGWRGEYLSWDFQKAWTGLTKTDELLM